MSMHKLPLTEIEREGLRTHGLSINKPSQLSDCFRLGIQWQEKHSGIVPSQNNDNSTATKNEEKYTLINEIHKGILIDLFDSFVEQHDWSSETKTACTYSFYHIINLINKNILIANSNNIHLLDHDLVKARENTLNEAIKAVKSCEFDTPNSRKVRIDQVVGSLINLK